MKKKASIFAVLIISLLIVQFGGLSPASAAADTDLAITGQRDFANQGIKYRVCNNGTTSIKEIEFDISLTNATLSQTNVSIFESPPSDRGSFDNNTLGWTGVLAATECLHLISSITETGDIGEEVTSSISIVSATQIDDTINTDTNPGDETLVLAPYTISGKPDLDADTHLITTGTITPTTTVEYGITITNIGTGQYNDGVLFMFAFILPPDSTFDSFTDSDNADILDIDSCTSPGTIGDTGFPGIAAYNSRILVICMLTADGGVLPADDTVYPFTISIVAGTSMASGTADVIGILEGNDEDTLRLFETLTQGGDPLLLPNNGIIHLTFDPSALSATVARCTGQGEVTNDGTGCFTITFNKMIYAPSFGVDDIDLDSNGTIDSLTQLDDYNWEIRISNIALNSTATLLLHLNQIQDYSAQLNTTQVLGINTIRYEDTTSPSGSTDNTTSTTVGTLPTTGLSTTYELITALILIASGAVVLAASRRRNLHKTSYSKPTTESLD